VPIEPDPPACQEHTPLPPLRGAARECPRCGRLTFIGFRLCPQCASRDGTCVLCGEPATSIE